MGHKIWKVGRRGLCLYAALHHHVLALLADFEERAERVLRVVVAPDFEFVVHVSLEAVGHLDAAHGVGLEVGRGELVEEQFEVAYGVEVAVDVEVGVGRAVRGRVAGVDQAWAVCP